ncbi:MAG: ATP cone domain-containing protein, partial [Burkholderiales bacterium]
MQLVTEGTLATPLASVDLNETPASEDARYAQYRVIRRNGSVVGFEPSKISIAMTKAFIAVNGGQGAASARVREQVAILTRNAVVALMRRQPSGGTFHIEDIQDQVELALMRSGEHNAARAYVLYREERTKERAKERDAQDRNQRAQQPAISVK